MDSLQRLAAAFIVLASATTAQLAPDPLVIAPHLDFGDLLLNDFDVGDLDGDAAGDVVFSTLFGGVYVSWGDGLGGFSGPQEVLPEITGDLDVGDLDGDGLDDVAYVPNSGADVRVLLSLGDGAFGGTIVLPTTVKPLTLLITDVDKDFRNDLAVAEVGQVRVQIWTGKVGGGFDPPYDVSCTKGPSALAFGDVDGDGWPDMASASNLFSGARVAVTLSKGGGQFASSATLLIGIDLHTGDSLVVADIDNDDLGDVLLAGHEDGLVIFRGQADGVPAAAEMFPTPLPCQSLAAADFDDDRLNDVAAGQEGGLVTLFRQGDESFLPALHYAAAIGPLFVRALDVNLDGHGDLLCSNGFVLTPLFGEGGGSFRPCYGFTSVPEDIAAEDFDGDTLTDFVVALPDGPGVVLPGQAGVGLGRAVAVNLGTDPLQVFAGPFDGDAYMDILALLDGPSGGLSLVQGVGDGAFGSPILTPVPPILRGAAAGDIDGDHLLDAVVLQSIDGLDLALPFLSSGDGTFDLLPSLAVPGLPVAAAVGKLNPDDQPDIVVLTENELLAYRGMGAGAFAPPLHQPFAGIARAMATADFDGDVYLDLAVLHGGFSPLHIYHGNGYGTWDESLIGSGQSAPRSLTAGDIDGDGDDDIVVTSNVVEFEQPYIAILLNLQGAGFIFNGVALASGEATSPIIADIGGDGRPDLAVLIPEGFQLDLYPNAHPVFEYLGHSLDGTAGLSRLVGAGTLQPDSSLELLIDGATPLAPTVLVAGLAEVLLPFKGGVLVPSADLLLAGLVTDADGNLELPGTWPPGVPSQLTLALQAWCTDAGGPQGLSATAALRATTP